MRLSAPRASPPLSGCCARRKASSLGSGPSSVPWVPGPGRDEAGPRSAAACKAAAARKPELPHWPQVAAERARRGHRRSVQRTRARVGNTSGLPRERREGGRARRAPAARLRREPSRPPPAAGGASEGAEARPEVAARRAWGRSRITAPPARRAVRGAGQQVRRRATADGGGPESFVIGGDTFWFCSYHESRSTGRRGQRSGSERR